MTIAKGDPKGSPFFTCGLRELLALLHGLRDIGHVTLHLLAVLVAEAGFGVVGVLHAVRGYGLLVAQLHPTVLANDILFLEDTGEKPSGNCCRSAWMCSPMVCRRLCSVSASER